jgi:Uma2 family endonuclease
MSAATKNKIDRQTLADLARIDAKAELINGTIVTQMPTGYLPSRVAFRIARGLDDFAESTRTGYAFGDNVGFIVPRLRSGRESFAPDASFYIGAIPSNPMRFIEGAPTFAVEVRSENDYGASAEAEAAAKRLDYFEAGTRVVWDVDPILKRILKYRSDTPLAPIAFAPGGIADAEPAVAGWTIEVDRDFAL